MAIIIRLADMRHFPLALVILLIAGRLCAQDPLRFRKEVIEIQHREKNRDVNDAIIFTGSSSIRLWGNIEERFPGHNVINTGFGGSQMSDMFYYAEELIVSYKPKQIFIYQGDNDLGEKKTPEQILSDADKLLKYIRGRLPSNVQVAFMTPKPSILRWHMRSEYENYIRLLKDWAKQQKNVVCVDVWSPMINANGELKKDLFLSDDLHMNSKGYDLWTVAIQPYLKKR